MAVEPSSQESLKNFLEARDFILSRPNYEEAKANFKWPELGKWNWGVQYFNGVLAEQASNPAVIWVDDELLDSRDSKTLTFQRLKEDSDKLVNALEGRGYSKGDSVLVMTGNDIELYTIFLGLLKGGMPIVPATILLSTEDIIDRVKRANVKAVFADKHAYEKIESIRSKLEDLGVKDFVSIGEDRKGWLYFEDLLSEGGVGYNKIVTKADDIALI
ncbi:MAG: AMP-binding protein, partial [Desulfurococcales archaeon]|nr:AMP-binding protein [Desulfurococcales archaeon]